MKSLAALGLALLLAACASAPSPVPPATTDLFSDRSFAPPAKPPSAVDVFALNDEMRRYIHSSEMSAQLRTRSRQRGLIEALYNKKQLRLEYDSAITRNAAEAFDARAGNCLSLVIMTAAFAREIGLEVQFQSVLNEETWGRSGDLYLAMGHVNLSLSKRRSEVMASYPETDSLVVDFMPAADIRGQRTRVISEENIVAMYMSNRAAESLAAGQVDEAYWWIREAILRDPKYLSAYNTLGVVYRRHGDLQRAEQVFRQVLEREPGNTQVMANLALTLEDQGRLADARTLRTQLAQIQPNPPFSYFNRGLTAMRQGDFNAAKQLFTKEVDRAAYYHEFHFWLALAHYALGELPQARQQLTLALDNTTTRRDHDLYAAKLDKLKAVSRAH
ncbi:MAG: tetratricopeptide repeat protein [Burkholderiaceae bacterium]|nr:tetratricopeptide repeat protein [Burkholderiaceae bacterium]